MTSDGDRSCMSCQSFSDRELLDHLSELFDCTSGIPNHACTFYKIRHTKRRKEPGRSVCRQYMARTSKVIPDDRRRVTPDENRTGIPDVICYTVGFCH